ncbi:hypothetical protein EVAR_45897_1 [Eumeta japonica]|uniref:Uncharacterized protein n=1 Tax=Eumeta variegata TaxID=151549 RepID=A0A4C1XPW8_EUMVA|nr:hypothetical protein EVAR_45897_1 [Eumeta japonica]
MAAEFALRAEDTATPNGPIMKGGKHYSKNPVDSNSCGPARRTYRELSTQNPSLFNKGHKGSAVGMHVRAEHRVILGALAAVTRGAHKFGAGRNLRSGFRAALLDGVVLVVEQESNSTH